MDLQITPDGSSAEVSTGESGEEVVTVTGSRIAGSTVQQASHVAVVTAKDLEKTNATTVDEALRRMPSVSLQGINKQANNGGDGLATIDLRNLGAGRTLILINGRRVVNSGGEVVDLNTIPTAMVERIDVLLEGASVIYGSDAVGGVINIILKDDFEGVRADVFGGISGRGDGEELGGSLTMGTNYDRGNITVNIQALAREPIWQRDRDWAKESISDRGYNNGYDGTEGIYTIYGSSAIPEGRIGGDWFKPDAATGLPYQPFTSANEKDHRFFFSKRQYLTAKTRRLQVTMLGDYDLNNRARAFVEGSHTYRYSQTRLAPQPFIGGNSTYPDGFQVRADNKYVPQEWIANNIPAGTDLSTVYLPVVSRKPEVGDRINSYDVNTTRVVVGLAGDLPSIELDWEIYLNYGISRGIQQITNSVNLARAMESADPGLCALNAAKGCVVGDYFGAGQLQPAVVDYIRYTDIQTNGFQQISSGASVSAKPWELWAGKLGLAGGALYRKEYGYTQPSPVTIAGESGGNGLDATKGDFSSIEFFGEAGLPLITDLPGFKHLDVDLAGRFSWYDSFGSEITYRVSGIWAPVDDIKFRGTYSTAFRNPGIEDLYGGAADSYETLTDPCNDYDTAAPNGTVAANCAAAGVPAGFNQNNVSGSQIRTNVGGNKDLEAETAKVWSVGGVATPTFFPEKAGQLTLSVDYYNVSIDNAITNPEPQFLLDDCYNSPNLSRCKGIARSPSNGSVSSLQANLQNIGSSLTDGIDIAASYDLGLGALGVPGGLHAIVGWQGNRLLRYIDTINGTDVRYDNKITPNAGTFTDWRWVQTTTVAGENWSLTSYVRYIGGARYFNAAFGSIPDDWVDQITYWDLSGQYTVQDFTVTAGVQNVLDKDPPFFLDGDTNSNGNTYDYTGRFFFTRLSYKM